MSRKDDDSLAPPYFSPDDKDPTSVVIDISLIAGDFVLVFVPPWDWDNGEGGPRPYDTYTVYFNNSIWVANIVQNREQADWPFFPARFHKGEIPNGTYDVYYTVQDYAQNPPAYSKTVSVTVINASESAYPAPVFPDSSNGQETFKAITAHSGVRIAADYPAIQEGDKVLFTWHGMDVNGEPVPASAYSVEIEVKDQNGKKKAEALIPEEAVLYLGSLGQGTAYYHVKPADTSRGPGDSQPGKLRLSFSDIDRLDVNTSQGAPVQIPGTTLQGMNRVRVFGRPGASVYVSLVTGTKARIVESGEIDYSFMLDEQGMKSFGVWPNGDYNPTLTFPASGPSPIPLIFRDAKNGPNPALSYGVTSGAAAESPLFGLDPSYCSVYVKVDRVLSEAKQVRVILDGAAFVRGVSRAHAQNAPISLNRRDGTASFQVMDPVAETVNVTLSLGDGTPDTKFKLEFDLFPSWMKVKPIVA